MSMTLNKKEAVSHAKARLNTDCYGPDIVPVLLSLEWNDYSYHFIFDQDMYSAYAHEYEFVLQEGQDYAVMDCRDTNEVCKDGCIQIYVVELKQII